MFRRLVGSIHRDEVEAYSISVPTCTKRLQSDPKVRAAFLTEYTIEARRLSIPVLDAMVEVWLLRWLSLGHRSKERRLLLILLSPPYSNREPYIYWTPPKQIILKTAVGSALRYQRAILEPNKASASGV